MAISFFDHTGDVGVDLTAPTLDALFADAAVALVRTIACSDDIRSDAEETIDLSAPEVDLLLVDWLSELLFRFDSAGFLPAFVLPHVWRDEGWRLRAEIRGEPCAALRVPIAVLVKGITYHALQVEETDAGWRARIIFDI